MTVVYDTSIDLTNKWHPSVDHVEVSVVRTPTLSDTSLWTNYIGPTVKTLHEAAGVHVRVHHRGSSSELLDIQRHASVVLTSLFGTSDGSIDDPIAFASTVVYANASCDLSTSVLSQVLHMQEVVSSTAKGHDHVRITSPQLAKKSHVVGSIVHGAAHILSLVQPTDADAIVVVPSTTRHDVVRRAHSRMVGSGFHQVLRLTVESRIVPGNLHDETCSLLVSQTFPTTAYADMDELRIPVGNLNDGRFVTAVTLLVSVGGCLLLYLTLLKKRDTASPSSSAGPSSSWVPRHTKQA
ncbi:hypothetical protein DYB26_002876 [Aphanomyces astaci]|uniref:Uncharacterized protein n=1 Tax=Aphanomyces astaci TaxID=112090 RepID=A0A397D323_APHAT|nr:hypothetical protein DYB38_006811 [Aphanomyces astaci]RHY88284.1 hypothetical protein DYB26_002876 [Aphanomyces astaci]